jgi:hypothetical protein
MSIPTMKMNLHLRNNVVNLPVVPPSKTLPIFNKNMHYYVCSFGGCGSTILFSYLKQFGNVYHIHDRHPPDKLCYIGGENTTDPVYSEWFNKTEIPANKLATYKVIYIYRDPIYVIFSRCTTTTGPNVAHLQHIQCINNGNIWLGDVVSSGKDLYQLEEFFDHYMVPRSRNYPIYAVKYEQLFEHMSLFNKVLGIPDIPHLYPKKKERTKRYTFVKELSCIYASLIGKMRARPFIQVVAPINTDETQTDA